jgi:hypothetical protein
MVTLFKLPKDAQNRDKIVGAVAQHCYDKTQFQVIKIIRLVFVHRIIKFLTFYGAAFVGKYLTNEFHFE